MCKPDLDTVDETPATGTLPIVNLEEMKKKTIDDLNDKIKNLEAPPQPIQQQRPRQPVGNSKVLKNKRSNNCQL